MKIQFNVLSYCDLDIYLGIYQPHVLWLFTTHHAYLIKLHVLNKIYCKVELDIIFFYEIREFLNNNLNMFIDEFHVRRETQF